MPYGELLGEYARSTVGLIANLFPIARVVAALTTAAELTVVRIVKCMAIAACGAYMGDR